MAAPTRPDTHDTAADTTVAAPPAAPPTGRGRWIDDWRPEDPQFWESTGKQVARRNLFFSIFSEHIGFSIWSLWSVLVLFLPEPVFGIDPAGKFLLTTLPTALGAFVRLPYTFAVAKFGGRNWTIVSAALLLIPTIATGDRAGARRLLHDPAGRLLPRRRRRRQLRQLDGQHQRLLPRPAQGLGARPERRRRQPRRPGRPARRPAGAGHRRASTHPRLILAVYIPLIVVAAVGAALVMDNLATARNQPRAMREATREPHTWIMSFLYIGTFGSFIGFGFAFGQVLQNQFTGVLRHPAGRRVADLARAAARLADPAGGRHAWPTGSAAPGSPAGTSSRWRSARRVVLDGQPGWSRCRCSSSASCCCSCSAASATARPTR